MPAPDPDHTWHKIAESLAELRADGSSLKEIRLGERTVCLAIYQDRISACAHTCPHAGGRMVDGYIDPLGNIVCPLHRYKFSLANGRNVSGEGYYLRTYPIEERADGVFIRLPGK